MTLSCPGFTSVTIWCTKLDDNLDQPLIDIQLPKQSTAETPADGVPLTDANSPKTWIVNLGRVKRVVTIQGMLIDESGSAGLQKKINVFNMVKAKKDNKQITVTWGTTGSRQQTITGDVNKVMVTETAGIIADGDQPSGYESEKNFAIQLSIIEGKPAG